MISPWGCMRPCWFRGAMSLGVCPFSWLYLATHSGGVCSVIRRSCRRRICPGHSHGGGKRSQRDMCRVSLFFLPGTFFSLCSHKHRPTVFYPQPWSPERLWKPKIFTWPIWGQNLTFTVTNYLWTLCHSMVNVHRFCCRSIVFDEWRLTETLLLGCFINKLSVHYTTFLNSKQFWIPNPPGLKAFWTQTFLSVHHLFSCPIQEASDSSLP